MNKILPPILFLLLTFPWGSCRAQVLKSESPWFQRDKLVHFTWSAGFTPALIQVLEIKGIKKPEIIGASLMFGAGVAKEFLLDSQPRVEDVVVNLAGSVAGIYLNRWLNKTWNNNHAKKRNIQRSSPPAPKVL